VQWRRGKYELSRESPHGCNIKMDQQNQARNPEVQDGQPAGVNPPGFAENVNVVPPGPQIVVVGRPDVHMELLDLAIESYSSWYQRFQLACLQQGLATEPEQRNYFLTSIGARSYDILRKKSRPQLPAQKTLQQLNQILESKYEPQGFVHTNRLTFNARVQGASEKASEFAEALIVSLVKPWRTIVSVGYWLD